MSSISWKKEAFSTLSPPTPFAVPTSASLLLESTVALTPPHRVSTSATFSALLFSPGSSAAATKPSPSSAAPPAASATPPSILGRVSTPSSVTILNNYDWWKDVKLLDFLREVGRFARVGTMMSKESVRKRLESDQGMSYTEFTYQLLQGYDFLRLFRDEGVNVQIGGSDQWGNITAGTDLIRRILQTEGAYGLTFPLLLKSDGTKFGKSEDGAIWLSPSLLSPYQFYQYFFSISDADVVRFSRF
ncbi:UNVERIFIED_CONTAM: Tyrosine--tRNA ligase, chloroplastic/mitochondrial [Sesamum latifolium]|uniref:Tyrosine--tRNA ligase n=1 Tax=Sesamum latifolium TaxID=2727402 RepID=A0AAW2X108_9LAMI